MGLLQTGQLFSVQTVCILKGTKHTPLCFRALKVKVPLFLPNPTFAHSNA